jgi:hypothetical protein
MSGPREASVLQTGASATRSSFSRLLVIFGAALVAVSWTASWGRISPLGYHAFFPLWLGYIFIVDGLIELRTGSSPLRRAPGGFAALFVCSVPIWWIFELLNLRLDNWSYKLPHHYSWLAYHAEASLAFSSVAPAILITAEFYGTVVPARWNRWRRLELSSLGWSAFAFVGLVILALVLVAPRQFFPFTWISLFFVVDPVTHMAGGSSIATAVAHGSWRRVLLLFASGLTCGFFWEMWNSRAMPKWTYSVPHANWLHLFEMPALGYGGYLPFALEVYAVVKLVDRVCPFLNSMLQFDRGDTFAQCEITP